MSLSPASSQSGRLAQGPFVLAVCAVYLASFISQMLLSAPVTARASVAPFVLAQIILIAVWIVLHQRRLRDAGRPGGIVVGVALVYALEVVLLALLVWILTSNSNSSDFAGSTAGVFHLFTILYLVGVLTGDPGMGAVQMWLLGLVALIFLPVVIAMIFSIWAATRPSLSSTP